MGASSIAPETWHPWTLRGLLEWAKGLGSTSLCDFPYHSIPRWRPRILGPSKKLSWIAWPRASCMQSWSAWWEPWMAYSRWWCLESLWPVAEKHGFSWKISYQGPSWSHPWTWWRNQVFRSMSQVLHARLVRRPQWAWHVSSLPLLCLLPSSPWGPPFWNEVVRRSGV